MPTPADRRAAYLWIAVAAIASATWLFVPPIAQPLEYHRFADWHTCLGIANGWDNLTNLLFFVSGGLGLRFMFSPQGRNAFSDPREALPYSLFFVSTILVGFGSGYYHLAPDNSRLLWDRAAIMLAIASWFAAIMCERVSVTSGLRLLPLLYAAGLGSVVYWGWSEMNGHGDLRAYGLMQLYPLLLVPLLLWLYPPRYSGDRHIGIIITLYVLAMVCDFMDQPIMSVTGMISGHTIKHIVVALAMYWVMLRLKRRNRIQIPART